MGQDKNRIDSLLKGKSSYGKESTEYLGGLVDQYPYAPIFHFLYLRSLQEEDSYKFPSQLNRSSVSTMNRSALFDWAEEPLVPIEVQMAAIEKRLSDRTSIQLKGESKIKIQIPEEKIEKNKITVDKELKDLNKSLTLKTKTIQLEKPSIESLDLSSLPDKVRAQILRSRAIKEQLSNNRKGKNKITEKKDFTVNETVEKQKLTFTKENSEKKDVSQNLNKKSPIRTKNKTASISINNSNLEDKIIEIKKNSKSLEDKKSDFQDLSPFAQFLLSLNTDGPKSEIVSSRDGETERKILQQFLELNPKISAVRGDKNIPDLTLKTPNVSGLVTETLANHYYDKGAFVKAIQAYEILKLKVPQKSGIFAARISEMRNLQFDKK
jgi:hypothetical protein